MSPRLPTSELSESKVRATTLVFGFPLVVMPPKNGAGVTPGGTTLGVDVARGVAVAVGAIVAIARTGVAVIGGSGGRGVRVEGGSSALVGVWLIGGRSGTSCGSGVSIASMAPMGWPAAWASLAKGASIPAQPPDTMTSRISAAKQGSEQANGR